MVTFIAVSTRFLRESKLSTLFTGRPCDQVRVSAPADVACLWQREQEQGRARSPVAVLYGSTAWPPASDGVRDHRVAENHEQGKALDPVHLFASRSASTAASWSATFQRSTP